VWPGWAHIIKPGSNVSADRTAHRLVVLLAVSGITHFAVPRPYDMIVPRSLPGTPRLWTYVSGAAELATAAALASPRTRKWGGLAAAGLFAAVFPANVKMTRDWRDKPAPLRALAWGRLPLQAPLIWSGLSVARAKKRDESCATTRK
jgi:uncharacterized membrane protein